MILAAGLLVLLGLGLFIAGLLTGATALYWGCVAVCVVAAVLIVLARRQLPSEPGSGETAKETTAQRPAEGSPADAEADETPSAEGEQAHGATAVSALPDAAASEAVAPAAPAHLEDPPVEEVEVTDLLVVVDLKDEVLVLDERPRYHLAGCVHLAGHTPLPLPLDEARADGFTPCGACAPDRNLAEQVRARRDSASD